MIGFIYSMLEACLREQETLQVEIRDSCDCGDVNMDYLPLVTSFGNIQ